MQGEKFEDLETSIEVARGACAVSVRVLSCAAGGLLGILLVVRLSKMG